MKSGEVISGFIIKSVEEIDEIHVTLVHAEHKENGANVFWIKSEDKENLFGLCFKTYPEDDKGAAHILEHTVLCGSKNYPVRDPFFSMLRRSCNTFMNAFTAKLWTGYVASSQIEKDFYNILSVYIDATLNPLLTNNSFMQEGHRIEFSNPDNIDSPLIIKGIVYNEMKGVFSNPSSIVWRGVISHLFGKTDYGYDSGGIPKNIKDLSHEELINFHKKYYDRRRCNYFFYGDIPLKKHLDFLNEKVFYEKLEKISQIPPSSKIARFNKPKVFAENYYSTSPSTDPIYFSLGFVTCGIDNLEDTLTLLLLDIILMDTDASLLKKKILKSKKCKDIYSLYDTDAREIPYIFYCIGAVKEDKKLEEIIIKSLLEVKKEGISKKWIEGALHQLEFSKLEIAADRGPYGLELMGRVLMPYQQGANLSEGLKIATHIESLREKLKDKEYLPNFIDKYFLNNNHKVSYTLLPDPYVLAKEEQEEKNLLESLQKRLSEKEKISLQERIKQFSNEQENAQKENIDCLPSLSINDIPKQVPYYKISKKMDGNSTIYHHDVFTNSIYYVDLVFDIPQIKEVDLPYLKLFSSIITELGTKTCSWEDNMQRCQRYFGSIHSGLALNVQRDNINTCYPTLSIASKFLTKNKQECFSILKDTILHIDVEDKNRIKDLIIQIYSSLESDINRKAMGYALKQSASHLSPWTHLSNLWYGAPYYHFMKNIIEDLDGNIPTITQKFTDFTKKLFHFNNAHIVISCEEKDFKEIEKHSFYDLISISFVSSAFHPWIELPVPLPPKNLGFEISSAIAHNALSIPGVTLTSDLAPALKIATYLLENIYIHNMVREKGGAYGSGVKYNILTGVLSFFSSRDPHIFSTINAFFEASNLLYEKEISDRELTEAILSYIQDVDSPVPVGSRASVTYFQEKVGLSKEVRQDFRDKILSLKKQDIKKAVGTIILPQLKEYSVQVSYANIEKLEKANLSLKKKLKIEKI
jgi:Zn-dependent M16 (insulinase) family peptidase